MAVVTEAAAEAQPILAEPEASPRKLGSEQVGVAAGQLTAGLGNLAFTLVASRLLDPGDFAHLSVFLGLYLVLSLPAASISAAAALSPSMALLRRGVTLVSAAVGVAVAAASPLLSPLLHLPIPMLVALALATPAVGPLAAQRGRLYAWRNHRWVVASLLAEPAVRLSLGVALAAGVGAVGGAAGVVVAAYAALETARRCRSPRIGAGRPRAAATAPVTPATTSPATTSPATTSPATTSPVAATWAAAAFGVLAVVQNQDLIFANRLLGSHDAGAYAALSTLGGAAAFATVTIPLVLLPRAVRGERHALTTAVVLAAALGAAAVAVGAIAPAGLVSLLFGSRYRDVAGMVVPYLAAMGLLGVARVVVAHRCATGRPKAVLALSAVVAAGQAASIVAFGHSVDSIATTTVGAAAVLTVALGAEHLLRRPPAAHRRRLRSRRLALAEVTARPAVRAVVAISLVGLAIRLVIFRGIWLDEATSIYQAGLPFGGMLKDLRDTDVHPPLYYSILWVTDRLLGNGSLAMRVPSIIAGELVIPAAYLAARDLWSRRTGVIAAAVVAVGPILVWYSQEARMYSMFMLFATLAVWGQVRVLKYGRRRDWAVFTLSCTALVWTEYFGAFQVIAQQVAMAGAVWSRRRDRDARRRLAIGWGASTAVLLLLLAPLVPFCWHQFVVNQNTGKGFGTPSQVGLAGQPQVSIYSILANLAWAALGYHSAGIMAALVALWPVGILASVFLLGRRISPSTRLVLAAAVIPTLMLIGIAELKPFLLDIRYISGVVVMISLLTARLITGSTHRLRTQAVACVALVAVLLVALGDEQVNGSNPRLYDFGTALHWVNARYRPGDVLLYDPGDLDLVIKYYSPDLVSAPVGALSSRVPPGRDVFVLGSQSLMGGDQPHQLGDLLSELTRSDRHVATYRPANVTVWQFEARP